MTLFEFLEEVCDRFGVGYINYIVEEFNRLELAKSLHIILANLNILNINVGKKSYSCRVLFCFQFYWGLRRRYMVYEDV